MKQRAIAGQLTLGLQSPDVDACMACRGLFSVSYLKRHVLKADFVPSLDAASRLHAKFKALWEEERDRLPRQHERYTCSAFLEPILADLGWFSLPEKALPFGQTRKRPDFCLFTSSEARNAAAESTDPVRVFSLAVTVKAANSSANAEQSVQLQCMGPDTKTQPQGFEHALDFQVEHKQYRFWLRTEPEMAGPHGHPVI